MQTEPSKTHPPKGDSPTPRRRFQFRLRTLMIGVTLLAVACGCGAWAAREVTIVHRRRHLFHYAAPRSTPSGVVIRSLTPGIDRPSLLRRWLGAETFLQIVLDDSATDEELLQYRAAYQEAEVLRFSDRK